MIKKEFSISFERVEHFHGELTVPDDFDYWEEDDKYQWLNDKMTSKYRWVEIEDYDYRDVE